MMVRSENRSKGIVVVEKKITGIQETRGSCPTANRLAWRLLGPSKFRIPRFSFTRRSAAHTLRLTQLADSNSLYTTQSTPQTLLILRLLQSYEAQVQ